MRQGITEYVSSGMRNSKRAIKESDAGIFRYIAFSIASLPGKLFFLSFPMFAFAQYHMANQVEKREKLSLEGSLEDASNMKKYWAGMQFALFSHIIFITGLLVLGGLSYGLIQMGRALDHYLLFDRYYTMFLFQVVSLCLVFVFIIAKALHFGPVAYLIQSNGLGFSEALHQGNKLMSEGGKTTLFTIHLYYLVRVVMMAGIGFGLAYGASMFAPLPVLIAVSVGVGAVFLRMLPRVMLAHKLSASMLFVDLVKAAAQEHVEDESMYALMSSKVRKDEILLSLFNDSSSKGRDEMSDDNEELNETSESDEVEEDTPEDSVDEQETENVKKAEVNA